MKRLFKIAAGAAILSTLAVVGAAAYGQATWRRDFSSTTLPAIHASSDADVVARGEYLVQAVGHCTHCHGADLSGGPPIEAGPFGRFFPANLTPDEETGLGGVSDEHIARAIRSAVNHDKTLGAMMLVSVGPMADEDLRAILSYLRTLPPKKNLVAASEWGIAAKVISGRMSPRDEVAPAYAPAGGVSVERGAYLANGPAACVRCHTTRDPLQGFAATGVLLAGDVDPHVDTSDPGYEIFAPNLTPDAKTGILTSWSEEQLIARFRAGRAYAGSIMPWESYQRLTDDDVKSLYRYLRSLPATENDVGPSRRPAG